MRTTIYGTDNYVDLVPLGRRLFLSPGLFGYVEVTDKIKTVSIEVLGNQTNIPSAILMGTLGTAVGGLVGTAIGVALAKRDDIVLYHIVFKEEEDLPEIYCITSDKYLIHWLDNWIRKER